MQKINATIIIAVIASSIGSGAFAGPATVGLELAASANQFSATANSVELAHAQKYRHCHNIMTRVYCHKSDSLPRNWPPFSDTPSRS